MELGFTGKRIAGVLSVLPQNVYTFEEETANPNDVKAKRLKSIIGYGNRRRVKGTTTLSDMLIFGIRLLIDNGYLNKDEIGAGVVSTLSQDYVLPTISSIIHGEIGLSTDVMCIDIPQACAGFVVGAIESFMLLDHMTEKKVLLCTGEIFNRKSRNDEPKLEEASFGGDIANISIIENDDSGRPIVTRVYSDGSGRDCLQIKSGGFRNPMTEELIRKQTSNLPCSGVEMDGSSVFNFMQRVVPDEVDRLLEKAEIKKEEIDFYIFHQPNKFMLQKLSERIGVPYEKVPMSITETQGNSDSGTIPAVMTECLSEKLLKNRMKCCFSGFGAGLTCASMVMEMDPMRFCESVVSEL